MQIVFGSYYRGVLKISILWNATPHLWQLPLRCLLLRLPHLPPPTLNSPSITSIGSRCKEFALMLGVVLLVWLWIANSSAQVGRLIVVVMWLANWHDSTEIPGVNARISNLNV